MGTKDDPAPNDCYERALPGEPTFTLLARDVDAPGVVRQWAYARERAVFRGAKPESDLDMVKEARACATAMERWRRDNDGAWRS